MADELDLSLPISWKRGGMKVRSLLGDLQQNIVKPHGRNHCVLLLLRFRAGSDFCAQAVGRFSKRMPSALRQLREAERFRTKQKLGSPSACLLLSQNGYTALGRGSDAPVEKAFRQGMAARALKLGDPDPATWERRLWEVPDAIVVLAHHDLRELATLARSVGKHFRNVSQVSTMRMRTFRDREGRALEHFGFVDGISNPMVLQEDLDAKNNDLMSFGLEQFVTPCPGGGAKGGLGSYVVVRKLEQNVAAFTDAVNELAKELDPLASDAEYAAALTVGRFRDGTPLELHSTMAKETSRENSFSFSPDDGARCPFHAHIRKQNPRGTGPDNATDLGRLMLRRGMTYGRRKTDPATGRFQDAPRSGSGLFFMSYQASIGKQFEHSQIRWTNNPRFPVNAAQPKVGVDPLLTASAVPQSWPCVWGDGSKKVEFSFPRCVVLKGGGYFFAPSLGFLRSLDSPH
jgi:Dyp-type peroxidase family